MYAVFYVDRDNRPSVWSYQPNLHSAQAVTLDPEAQDYTARVFGRRGPLRAIPAEEYGAMHRAHYLDQPAEQIDPDVWLEMFEILPPQQWVSGPGLADALAQQGAPADWKYDRFNMSERTSGNITQQYLWIETPAGIRAYRKYVDAYDRSTWMNPEDYRAEPTS